MMTASDLTQPTASHHLNILEDEGLLKDKRKEKWIFYSLANPKILSAISKILSMRLPSFRLRISLKIRWVR
ncbi:helix-turn-helix transcriptional regulator [Candidatus Bathyarchaeota archaeon]|nr:helix-turn-helix transcriptional regulator [Candidatus Bathyarchaeota archaeon]